MIILSQVLPALVLPPFGPMILAAIGVGLMRGHRRVARGLIIAGLLLLYVSSTHAVADVIYRSLYAATPLTDLSLTEGAGAIVVLGAGLYAGAPEYGADTVGNKGLTRVRYGAHLHRLTGLPILVTGGTLQDATISEGEAMRRVLEDEFGVPVRWVEERSRNTRENAAFSYALLSADQIRKIVLVTHSYHMSRAVADFERAGFDVVPAPTSFFSFERLSPYDFLPSAGAMASVSLSLREWLGRAWSTIGG